MTGHYDTLIVGAGFTGATMARLLADAGQRVMVFDKRDHVGGNAYDYVNEHGVRIHKYGPHIFHTNSDEVFAFLSRFTEWRPYEHRVLASVGGKLVPFPINLTTLEMVFGRSFTAHEAMEFLAQRTARDWHGGEVKNAEDQIVSQVGRELYEMFFAGYTRKMWGVEARDLDKSVTARIPLRFNRDDRYFTDKHQAMPRDGYAALFERMLDHPLIQVSLNETYSGAMAQRTWNPMIWTGPIDDYFGHCFGPLPYRSLLFCHEVAGAQDAAVVNHPAAHVPWTRSSNWARITASKRWLLTYEYPMAEGEPYYPVPARKNRARYKRYDELARKQDRVTFLGRMGRYQYINMDQAVGQAMAAFKRQALGSTPHV